MCYTEDSKCFKVLKVVHCLKDWQWQSFKNLCIKISDIFLDILGISPILLLLGVCMWCGNGVPYAKMRRLSWQHLKRVCFAPDAQLSKKWQPDIFHAFVVLDFIRSFLMASVLLIVQKHLHSFVHVLENKSIQIELE